MIHFFQKDVSIYDFINIENTMLKNISKNVDFIEVTAESFDKYHSLISKHIEYDN